MCRYLLLIFVFIVCIATVTCTLLLLYAFDSDEEKNIIKECPHLDINKFSSLNVHCFFNNASISCDDKMPDGTIVNFTCKSMYESSSMSYNTIECENGNWSQPLLNCEPAVSHDLITREVNVNAESENVESVNSESTEISSRKDRFEAMCRELFSTSLNIKCFYDKAVTSCDDPMLHNTIAKLECKNSYQHDSIPYEEIRCENGTWNRPLFNCRPVCGKRASKASPLAIHGSDVDVGDFPWHVGLYKKSRSGRNMKHKYNCGGSIISPKLVITAAHCFSELDPWRYQVAAGKLYRKFTHMKDQHAQYRDVVDIHIHSKYDGVLNGFTADIAILVLNDVFILSNLVQPVCLDYSVRPLDINYNQFGEISGWGKTSELGSLSDYLQYLSLPLRSYQQCKQHVPEDFLPYVTFDKICAGYSNGTSVCTGDSGGGLVSQKFITNNDKEYYLIGLVSASPFKNDSCDSSKYTTFTNVDLHIDWINQTMFRFESWTPFDYGCKLPEPPTYGNYTVHTEILDERNLMPGSLVAQYTKLIYSCSEGYEVHGDRIITCKEKHWNVNNFFPMCFRKCLIHDSSEHEIEYSSEIIDGYILHETQASYRCFDSNYELEAPRYNQTTCRDGQWTRPLLNCTPVCGITRRQPASHTLNETYTYPGQYPWLVGVYFIIDSKNHLMEAAGAIISPFLVAMSVYDDLIEEATYLVVAGNTHYSYENNLNENTQQSLVYRIMHLTTGVARRRNTNEYILILKTRLNMTSFVRPICVGTSNPTDVNVRAEMPLWVENDENLRKIIFKFYNFRMKLTKIVTANNTTPIASIYAVPVSTPDLGTRYYFMGYGVFRDDVIALIRDDKSNKIQEISKKYNIKSIEMSECVVPDTPSNGRLINSNYLPGELVPETTKIKYNCQLSSYDTYSSHESTCKNNSWDQSDKEPFCVVCGMSELENNSETISPFESYYSSEHKYFPWHVGIYDKSYEVPQLFCSGTIISSKIILTFFNCFLDYIVYDFDENKFAIGAGKLYSDWDNPLDTHSQFVDIDNIVFNGERYRLLVAAVLKEHLLLTSYVLPVCLDVGGLTENPTNPLNEIIPVWSEEKVNGDKLKYLRFSERYDKENIVHKNTSFPCENYHENARGSSAVIRFKKNNENIYIIRSIVRNIFCPTKSIVFVNLYEYMDWLISLVKDNKI